MIGRIPDSHMPPFTAQVTHHQGSNMESLENQSERFYSWYLSVRPQSTPPEGAEGLLYIMQMGRQGTPTAEEAKKAFKALNTLLEDLNGGPTTLDQIPEEIKRVVDNLTEHNPKSKLVKNVMEIEIHMKDPTPEFKEMMETLIKKASSDMSHFEIEAMNRKLSGISPNLDLQDLKEIIFPLIE